MALIDVTCAIINIDGKILVVQRSAEMSQPFKWEFPGGKVESGESERDCLKREIVEELNIEIEIGHRLTPACFDYPNISIRLIPFIANYYSGELQLREHAQFALMDKHLLTSLDWAEADIPILNEFLNL